MKNSKGLQDSEITALLQLLTKSLDKKLLNSKNSVVYDVNTETILEIKNLVMHQNADGSYIFQMLDKPIRNAVTMRKKHTAQEATAITTVVTNANPIPSATFVP
jgi:predicted  nucleic acid-binding Zn-ribbon protein